MANRKGMKFPYAITASGKTAVSEDIRIAESEIEPTKTVDNISILNYTYKGQLPVDLFVGSINKDFSQEQDASGLFMLFMAVFNSFALFIPYITITDVVQVEDKVKVAYKLEGIDKEVTV